MLNVLTAALGTAIAEAGFQNLVHPQTVTGIYRKELLLSGAVAFALGCIVYFKWRSRVTLWVWVLGVTGFVWRISLGDKPSTFNDGALWVTLVFVSLRLVAYSAGAWCCSGLVGSIAPTGEGSQSFKEP